MSRRRSHLRDLGRDGRMLSRSQEESEVDGSE